MSGVVLPPVVLDRSAGRSLAVQVADALRTAAAGGALRPGDRLPSTRTLAQELAVSRTVTAAAYDQLLAEGWIAARRGSGTTVVGTPGRSAADAPRPAPAGAPGSAPRDLISLRAGVPCVEVLDGAAWRRAWRIVGDVRVESRLDAAGLPEFRAVVGEHLLRHRGLPVGPSAIIATTGSTAALAELGRCLPAGLPIAVEDPGYVSGAAALASAGHPLVGVPVDDEGLIVDAVPAGVAAVCVTPAHQYPMGARMSARRRVALVERARRDGFLVIEDDYDGELRYDVAPLPLLAALGPDVVAHLGTASKMLTPVLGCGWLVAPPEVTAAVLAARAATGTRPPTAGQHVVVALARAGDLGRHLRRLRRELAGRRATVVQAVQRAGWPVLGDPAGAHVVVDLVGGSGADEQLIVVAAQALGVEVDGLARHHRRAGGRAGLVLGYAGPTRADLDRALAVMTRVLAQARG
ncbi:PLP-dependent aminotransferase family protein [Nakamurella flava]|uniref:PLP-dependent aminotransferase family protein n=1 Tax=Nakamurella flava TaxID=2576308 RepID=A0A4U6QFT9_9ACTN|nr:PLP-dependent aminotransferase family protein [Nakamurella flava]